MLKPQGRLVVTNLTPLVSALWHKVAFWDKDQHERGMAEGEVYGFSHAQLQEMLDKGGYTIADRRRFSWGLNSIYICRKSAP